MRTTNIHNTLRAYLVQYIRVPERRALRSTLTSPERVGGTAVRRSLKTMQEWTLLGTLTYNLRLFLSGGTPPFPLPYPSDLGFSLRYGTLSLPLPSPAWGISLKLGSPSLPPGVFLSGMGSLPPSHRGYFPPV